MGFKRLAGNKGFTLVELLLVIVLIAILMALVTLSGANMVDSTNAQTEARRLIRTVHSLRSAWLSCYADRQITIGVGMHPESHAAWTQVSMDHDLSMYSDRSLADEIERYGRISVDINPGGKPGTYIGFVSQNKDKEIWKRYSSNMVRTMETILDSQKNDYGLAILNSRDIYIRIK